MTGPQAEGGIQVEDRKIYEDIALRTEGDIYIGVVGPVRTGKSTFIKRFMETMVIPNIENVYRRERARDELPQSGSGRTIMTAEPKFVPEEAVTVSMEGGGAFQVRLIDCVGYMVTGAVGQLEGEEERMVTTPPYTAYLKIAEGCSNGCAFCIIPKLRGRYRSRTMDSLLREARELEARGTKELIVIAQDITRYGLDLKDGSSLAGLLKELCKLDFHWIRLHYLYPEVITDELIDVIAHEKKIVHYLDIPIQHCNDRILKAMRRHNTRQELEELFAKLRSAIPDVVLRTSLICGLPGETDEEFEELCEFLREQKLQRAGVFQFSPEEGTRAARMDHVDMEEARRRAELVVDVQSDIIDAYNDSILGEEREVLCEGFDGQAQMHFGRSYAESPDIDGRIWFDANREVEPGTFVTVRLTGVMDGELTGELAEE